MGRQPAQREVDDELGLGTRHEDAGTDLELQPAEVGAAGEVLQRDPAGALGDEVGIPLRRLDATEDHDPSRLGDVLAAQVGGEVQGVHRSGLDTGLGERHRGAADRVAQLAHSPDTALRRACSSASTHEPMTASRSPSRTASRL